MGVLEEDVKKQVKEFLKDLEGEVTIGFYDVKNGPCEYCGAIKELINEVAELNPKIKVEIREPKAGSEIEDAPVLSIEGKVKGKVLYYGIPAGHEFSAFLGAIKIAGSGNPDILDEDTKKKAASIDKPVRIRVFVTPSCPYCPTAALIAYGFAVVNPNIRSETIEALEFNELANKYRVRAVPKIVANDIVEFEGAMPPDIFLKKIMDGLELK